MRRHLVAQNLTDLTLLARGSVRIICTGCVDYGCWVGSVECVSVVYGVCVVSVVGIVRYYMGSMCW